ncbi:MAG: hypothetical protein ACLFVP_08235 [Candidatus Bathyarchaeia archaeon]
MLPNHIYDLMCQIVQESQSLWRITKEYKGNAADCDKLVKFWERMEKDKEEHIDELEKLLLEQLKSE